MDVKVKGQTERNHAMLNECLCRAKGKIVPLEVAQGLKVEIKKPLLHNEESLQSAKIF